MNLLNLQGQQIKGLYDRSDDNSWYLLETNQATFELRLGGLNSTTEKRAINF